MSGQGHLCAVSGPEWKARCHVVRGSGFGCAATWRCGDWRVLWWMLGHTCSQLSSFVGGLGCPVPSRLLLWSHGRRRRYRFLGRGHCGWRWTRVHPEVRSGLRSWWSRSSLSGRKASSASLGVARLCAWVGDQHGDVFQDHVVAPVAPNDVVLGLLLLGQIPLPEGWPDARHAPRPTRNSPRLAPRATRP